MALTACQFMEEPGMAVQVRESKHPYNNNTNFEVSHACFAAQWDYVTRRQKYQGAWSRSVTMFPVYNHMASVSGALVE